MGKIRDNWQLAVFTVVITILGSGVWTYFQNRDKSIHDSASIEYVDKKTGETKIYIDIQDTDLKNQINKIEHNMDLKADKYHVESIEKKIDVIYEWVINNSKKP